MPDARRRAPKAGAKRPASATAKRPAKATTKAAPKRPANTRPAPTPPERKAHRRRGALGFALAAVVLVGLLFAFVYPTRTFLDQRSDTQRARAQLELLHSENARLAAESKRLQDPAEIEKLARGYGLVKPNERAFVIVPAPTVPPAPTAAPAPSGNTTPAP